MKKISFSSIKDALSRDEMKKIMAGSGEGSNNPNLQICFDCCNTAANITCYNAGPQGYADCVKNICDQCFAMFSSDPRGCY